MPNCCSVGMVMVGPSLVMIADLLLRVKRSLYCQVHVQGAGQINIAAAIAATVRVTPSAVTTCALYIPSVAA